MAIVFVPYINIFLTYLSLSVSAFDRSFCVYFCMFPVCPLCCFIVISMDPVSEINDDDKHNRTSLIKAFVRTGNLSHFLRYS